MGGSSLGETQNRMALPQLGVQEQALKATFSVPGDQGRSGVRLWTYLGSGRDRGQE